MQRPTVTINRRAADRLAAGHVWVYSSDVEDRGAARAGDTVTVAGGRGRILGTAHYSSSSQITLRLLSSTAEPVDEAFLEARLAAAVEYRRRAVVDADACRLVFSEADRLPGLIIDHYAGTLVMQTLTQGMDARKAAIAEIAMQLTGARGVWERNDAPVRTKEELPLVSGPLEGEPVPEVEIAMNGVRFGADLAAGQKTGVYLDQRENYLAARKWARGEALDCFTSTGGFALHLSAVCPSVEAVDSGAAALSAAAKNAERNGMTNIRFREADVFDVLAGYRSGGRRFGTVILDPPAFTKSKAALDGAVRGYREINLRALQLLESGGVLVTCSCSHHMSEALLLEAVAAAALDARRTLRVIERRTQAADHPILLMVPETLYLKCLILEVL